MGGQGWWEAVNPEHDTECLGHLRGVQDEEKCIEGCKMP